MVIINIKEHRFALDGILHDNLVTIKHDTLKKDYDTFLIIDGFEGDGKSTLAFQVALYLDNDFGIDKVAFTMEQFIDAVNHSKKGDCIVFDETMGYLSGRGSMSKFNKTLIKIFSEMRSKNLFIILCIPSIFELDKYPAIHRSLALFHVYKRGVYAVFNRSKKKALYIYGKKYYSYKKPSADFIGRFAKYFVLDREKYEMKKQQGIFTFNQQSEKEKRWIQQRNRLIYFIRENMDLSYEKIGNLIPISKRSVIEICEREKNNKTPPETPKIKVLMSVGEQQY